MTAARQYGAEMPPVLFLQWKPQIPYILSSLLLPRVTTYFHPPLMHDAPPRDSPRPSRHHQLAAPDYISASVHH